MIAAVEMEIVEIERWRGADPVGSAAFLTAGERERCAAAADGAASVAARWAAKCAVLRALGLADGRSVETLGREVEIEADPAGKPCVRLAGEARHASERAGIASVHVSLTHGSARAGAVAVLTR